ncbi:uncharacterized protein LOC106871653 isoform X2 [Octopus bimaculoides]|uniref:uncharacterized protein LOC106871653 isoform X2 n=1 Tax=Octopus bimaculoides TaxID=37653 RepID=UPI0022E6BC67|nr:uncharacterized protein LOC106871653 isoform X2 [Octopus bimaculoides]
MGISLCLAIWIALINVSPIQSTTSLNQRVRVNLALCITQEAGKAANETLEYYSAVMSLYKPLSIYSVLLKNYKQREYEVLCAHALCFEKPCPYPEACSKETPPSDGMHYCHLRKASDCLTELVNQLSVQITSKGDPEETLILDEALDIDETLLIPRFTSGVHRQLYIMATMQKLVADLSNTEYLLEFILS